MSADIIIIPIQTGDYNFNNKRKQNDHWMSIYVNNIKKVLVYNDSAAGSRNAKMALYFRWIEEYVNRHRTNNGLPIIDYECMSLQKKIPQQTNGNDFGMFVIKYAVHEARGLPYNNINPALMPHYRAELAEIFMSYKN